MRKIMIGLIVVFTFLLALNTVFAEGSDSGKNFRNLIRINQDEQDNISITPEISTTIIPKVIREEERNEKEDKEERNEGIFNRIKNFIKTNFKFDARITGTVTLLGTGGFTVDGNDGKTYTINVNDKTKYIRKFGGKSSFSELNEGDTVNVFGKFTDNAQLIIDAKVIRDLSIEKRWGVFFGVVKTKNSDGFVMSTISRGDQTVTLDPATTKILNHEKDAITLVDIKVNDRVRVKGIWDKTLNKITEVDEVRVFPVTPTKAPTATPTP